MSAAGAPAPRPFRHLCPEADRRDAMTDDEFWADVATNLTGVTWPDAEDYDGYLDATLNVGVCDVCGSDGACGYDNEGRALIHATQEGDDD